MQHEFNYNDEQLAKRKLKRLNIDPHNVEMKWIMDFCAQSLREIIIGMGGKSNGFMMKSGFAIAVSSEVMAILAVAKDLKDMRERMGRIVVAYSKDGKPVTTEDLGVAGAMTAWMVEALNPNLLQTIEGQPVFVHAGPFANIAIGQSSIIADRVGAQARRLCRDRIRLCRRHRFREVLEPQVPHVRPQAARAVIVATIRALKCHGGAPIPVPGKPMPAEYKGENVGWVEKGCDNLIHHIKTVKKAGINPVVCINAFYTDTDNEIKAVRRTRRGSRRPRGPVPPLGEGRRRRARVRRRGHRRLQREERLQVPLRASAPRSDSASN